MATGSGGGGGGGEKGKRTKVELLQEAIHGLLEEKRAKQPQEGEQEEAAMDHQEDLFLSSLLSKLDTLENDADLNSAEPNSINPDSESSKEAAGPGDIAKDLGKIKKQNMITHILLGTVMVMIAAWQFNEVSFLLAVQKKLTNPFKSLGDTIKSAIKRGKQPMVEGFEAWPLPPVGVPDVARADLPMLPIGDGDS